MENRLYLQSGPVTVRPLTERDVPLLLRWLTDPRVLEWYEGRDVRFTPELIREHFYEQDDDEPDMRRCIVEYQGKAVGYVQIYSPFPEALVEEYQYPHLERKVLAFDQFIGEPDYWGRGVGRAFLSLLLDHFTRQEQADAVILDPRVNNPRAIRCYEACGFQKVKLLPAHELHEGSWEDCWLMEYRPGALE